MIRVLYIDDDADAHRLLRITLPEGYTLISGLDARRGLKLASESDPDVILLDVDLPDANGLDVLDRISQFPAAAPIIIITGYAEIPLAVRSIQAGAADFIEWELPGLSTVTMNLPPYRGGRQSGSPTQMRVSYRLINRDLVVSRRPPIP